VPFLLNRFFWDFLFSFYLYITLFKEEGTQIGKAKHFKHPNMLAIGEKKRMII